MNEKDGSIVTIVSNTEPAPADETDWARVDAMTDEDIAAAVRDDPDAAPLDIDWSEARLVTNPPGAEPVTVLIDRDVVAWFRGQGPGLSQRINDLLRAYYEANRSR